GALLFDFLELDHFLVNDFYPLLQILVALLLVLETLTKNEQRYKRDDTAAQQRGQRERADKITASLLASGLSPIQQINAEQIVHCSLSPPIQQWPRCCYIIERMDRPVATISDAPS